MNKICLMPKIIEEINLNVDSLIIGYKNFNTLNTLELEIDEIRKISEQNSKELYISINSYRNIGIKCALISQSCFCLSYVIVEFSIHLLSKLITAFQTTILLNC